MKSNIKSKKFYDEAEDMQEGWGKYLRWIDDLKDKRDSNSVFTLNEFCWALYGEGHCSTTWQDFKTEMLSITKRPRYRYSRWNEIFSEWIKTYKR